MKRYLLLVLVLVLAPGRGFALDLTTASIADLQPAMEKGALHGVSIVVKDVFDTYDVPTTEITRTHRMVRF